MYLYQLEEEVEQEQLVEQQLVELVEQGESEFQILFMTVQQLVHQDQHQEDILQVEEEELEIIIVQEHLLQEQEDQVEVEQDLQVQVVEKQELLEQQIQEEVVEEIWVIQQHLEDRVSLLLEHQDL
jgi:hypothetical protein